MSEDWAFRLITADGLRTEPVFLSGKPRPERKIETVIGPLQSRTYDFVGIAEEHLPISFEKGFKRVPVVTYKEQPEVDK